MTGNEMFGGVKKGCEKILGKVDDKRKKKKGVLYWKKVNGKLGWYEFDDEKIERTKYIGEIENGEPNGLGRLICDHYYFCDNYEGEFKHGIPNGQGTETSRFGKYVGELKNGKKTVKEHTILMMEQKG